MKYSKRQSRVVRTIVVWVPTVHALIDMLRYDSCFPSSEVESLKIQKLLRGDATPGDHVLRLTSAALGSTAPSHERWESFGCHVLDYRSPDEEPITEAEVGALARVLVGDQWLK